MGWHTPGEDGPGWHHSDIPEPLISLTRKALGKDETSFRDLCRARALAGLRRDS